RRQGEVVSGLYPFKHAFYRKFGYETVQSRTCYELKPSTLRSFRFDGEAKQYVPGESAEDYLALYDCFSRHYNLAVRRSAEGMRRWLLLDKPLFERKFAYLLSENGINTAYVCFTDQYCDPAAKLVVTDIAWTEPKGLRAILGFLSRFEADYGLIELSLPTDLNLKLLLPDPYEIDAAKLTGHYMLRAVNVPKALNTLCGKADNSFTLAVSGDGILPENNGAWRVSPDGIKPFTGTPDAEMSLNAFNQLICGAIGLDSALYRADVTVRANAEALGRVFCARPAFLMDRF
ncbi:MAG: sterol carrier protein domain-containing protein, partial [Clostridia bacterium]|nr:sterol carrier protein domain-containing protein [Clostridia bacterium]